MAEWSFIITGKSQITTSNVQEASYNILRDGEVVLENAFASTLPTELVDLISGNVKNFALQWEASQEVPLNEEIKVI